MGAMQDDRPEKSGHVVLLSTRRPAPVAELPAQPEAVVELPADAPVLADAKVGFDEDAVLTPEMLALLERPDPRPRRVPRSSGVFARVVDEVSTRLAKR